MKQIIFGLTFTLLPLQSIHPQDLVETFQIALQNDPQFKISDINKLATAEFKSQSIAQMLPDIDFQATSLKNRLDSTKHLSIYGSGGIQSYWDNFLTVNLRQAVFHMDHWIQLDQAENKLAQAEAQYEAQLQGLMSRTAEAYFNVLAAQDNLEYTQAEKRAIGTQLEQAKQRFEVGFIAITDVYEAQAGYDNATALEIEAQRLIDNRKEALREIIGENPVELNPLHAGFPLNPPSPDNIQTWTENAESNNFALISQFNQTEFQRKNVDFQKSKHLPTVDIVALYRQEDNQNSFGFRGDNENVGLQFNLPLFEGGGTQSRVRQAQYEFEMGKQELIKSRRLVTKNVKDAYRGVISNISQVKALDAAVRSAEKAVEAALAGFEVGTHTMVDVITEEKALYKTRSDHARSRYDYLINVIKLKEAAGSLSETDLIHINQYITDSKS